MKKDTYLKIKDTIQRSSLLYNAVIGCDYILTRVTYIIYPLFLAVLAIRGHEDLISAVLVPAIGFVVLSVFRKIYNAPRPYEVFGVYGVINKKTLGKSFPSRHVFSIFVIAATIFRFYQAVGIMMFIAGILMAIVRVVGGVHFAKDVIAGAAFGILCGVTGFLF